MQTRMISTAACLFLVLTVSAAAHHSVAMFDQQKEVTIEGVMKELELVNPHSWFHVTVTDAAGKSADWAFEMQGLPILTRQGWTPDIVKPGEKVTVIAHPLKDGSRGGQFLAVRLTDGREFRFGNTPGGTNLPGGSP